ncbi:MAG TPA: FHA domain-containing protein [Gammaproteobacteria bacterium]|nr:FHA domain-containing protein [Gammaproteobacteria bacterium]
MSKPSSEDLDNDHTDELPVLLETVALGDEPLFGPAREDTSEHTALYDASALPSADVAALHDELAEHVMRSAQLQAEVRTLANRARELERHAAEKDQLIGELEHTVATLRAAADETSSAEHRLAEQLAVRDARIAEAATTVEQLQRESAARSAEIEQLRTAAATLRREADAAKLELAARPPANPALQDAQLLEDNAALRDYIAGRQAWWNGQQAKQASLTAKLTALQRELATSKKELATAEALATRESSRAVALRAELVDHARRVEELERQLRAQRAVITDSAPTHAPAAGPAPPAPPSPPIRVEGVPAPAAVPESPAAADAISTDVPAVEAIAQLEAEVGYKRQQVAAQLVELRERDQRLQGAAVDLERLRRELSAVRNELDESRSAVARLERAVIDKDRALEARDARIATLHEELKQRLGAIEKLNAIDFSMPKGDSPIVTRAAAIETAGESPAPALACLTGDAPKRFALTKKTTTVGRGQHCDLQILTHFVSREHARITVANGTVLIEDLGSRNGVYVNAVRVDRHALQQGDLITIGETQFRFMESMAH